MEADHRRRTKADHGTTDDAPPTMPRGRHEAGSLALRDSHRRWIRALMGEMRELLAELNRHGVADQQTAELRGSIDRLERAVGVCPAERGDVVGAGLTRLWVLSCELRAKAVRGYGELGPHEAEFFDEQSAHFEDAIARLRQAISEHRATDAGATG